MTLADKGESVFAIPQREIVVTEGPDGTFTKNWMPTGAAEVGGKYYASLQKAVDNAGRRYGYSAPGYGGGYRNPRGSGADPQSERKDLDRHQGDYDHQQAL